jgi:hypothetical protein
MSTEPGNPNPYSDWEMRRNVSLKGAYEALFLRGHIRIVSSPFSKALICNTTAETPEHFVMGIIEI